MRHHKNLITGGTGFIGSAVVRLYISKAGTTVINVEKLTCAVNPESLGKLWEYGGRVV